MARLVLTSRHRNELLNQYKPIKLKWYEYLLSKLFGTYNDIAKANKERQSLLENNAFGLVLFENNYPVRCKCGGSRYLCLYHANIYLKESK